MSINDENKYKKLKEKGLSKFQDELIRKELEICAKLEKNGNKGNIKLTSYEKLSDKTDRNLFLAYNEDDRIVNLFTLEELLDRDKQREEDGFPKRIRLGKFIKSLKENKEKIVVVPSTTEPKFYHDESITEDGEENTGGAGEGEEGEVIGEQQAEPEQGEGEGQGAGQGEGADHDITDNAFDLGKVITKKFELPNLKTKGKKVSTNKYTYELTDINRGFGQVLDKKATVKKILETNIMLENIKPGSDFLPEELILNPQDEIYRILSKEKDFEAQAIVFFIRDYSGSMMGDPTDAVVTQHLFIYSWLMYQYQNQVQVRFVLHDSEAKQVPDFFTYYKSSVAGGTNVYPAYELVAEQIENERLYMDNNIYVFHGTDGDDWEEKGTKTINAIKRILIHTNRVGITVAKNSWGSADRKTTVERYIEESGLLKEKSNLIKIDSFAASGVAEERLLDGIRILTS